MKLSKDVQRPETGVRIIEDATRVYIKNENIGAGTLFVTDNDVVWINSDGEGLSINYPDISLFAVCTDREKYAEDCIFMLVKDEDSLGDDSDSDEDFCDEAEIRFAPSDATDVKDLFNIIQECNKLHPNANDDMVSESDDDVDENESGDDFEDSGIVPNGSCHHANGQFDDAEMN